MKRYFVTALLVLAACATQPEEIATAYVSPLHYKNFDCDQLELEAERVSRRALELHANLKDTADTDEAQMGIGLILFWPALFFLEGGDGAEAMEYARIKGEREAIEKRSIEQKCAIAFQKTAAATSGIDQQAGLAARPAVPINFERDRPQILKAIREFYDDGPGESYDHPMSSLGGTMGTLKTLTKLRLVGDQIEVEAKYTWVANVKQPYDSDHTGKFVLKKESGSYKVVKMWSKNFGWK